MFLFALLCGTCCCIVCFASQEPRVQYIVTGFVQFTNGHFVGYVREKNGWLKCEDSVVSRLETGVGTIWPCLIFLEKMRRRQKHFAPEIPEGTSGTLLSRLPDLLMSAVTGSAISSGWERRVAPRVGPNVAEAHRPAMERTGTGNARPAVMVDAQVARRARERIKKHRSDVRKRKGRTQQRAGRKEKRTGREQERKGREQERKGREQERRGREQERRDHERRRREDGRERESRRRQEETLGSKTWSNNMSGHRSDEMNEEDHPFNRFRYAFPLRRKQKEEDLREWLEEPAPVAAQPCLLCQEGFEHRADLLGHIDAVHGGLQRYRNAFLSLEALCPHVVTGQEVRFVLGGHLVFAMTV